MEQQERFDDFLKLDIDTLTDFFTLLELKILLKTEPYNKETLQLIWSLMKQFEDREMYEWCAMLLKEFKRRDKLTIV